MLVTLTGLPCNVIYNVCSYVDIELNKVSEYMVDNNAH